MTKRSTPALSRAVPATRMNAVLALVLVTMLASLPGIARSAYLESCSPFQRTTLSHELTSPSELQTTKGYITKAVDESPLAHGISDETRTQGTERSPPQGGTQRDLTPNTTQADVQPVEPLPSLACVDQALTSTFTFLRFVDRWLGHRRVSHTSTHESPGIANGRFTRLSPVAGEHSELGDNRTLPDVDHCGVDHGREHVVELRGRPIATGVGVCMHCRTRGERGVALALEKKNRGAA